ncbi:MAG: aldo/keto reductase [Armatimonadetes bacterium]|nr:aldo/keto reductase [Armatimonadota bacterium]
MKQRTIANRQIGEIGLGCMGMSWAYGSADESECLRVLDRALEAGVNHWDTADIYGPFTNEELLAKALKVRRDQVFLATKFGNVADRSLTSHQDQVEAGNGWIVDGTPAYARKCLENSLKRLQVESIDLYYLHRVDPLVPIEETVGEMAKFVEEGKVKAIGISEVAADTVRRAHATHPIAAVQNELSLWTRDSLDDVLPVTEELGIAFVPYSPLGRGFLTGQIKSLADLPEDDWRRSNPRFSEENFAVNLELVKVVESIAAEAGATPAQVAIAWVLRQGQNVCPIPGTKKLSYLEQNVGASDVVLGASQLQELDALSEAAGQRYPEAGMAFIKG